MEDPQPLAGADVESADDSPSRFCVLADSAGAMRRADDDHIFHDDGRRMKADSSR